MNNLDWLRVSAWVQVVALGSLIASVVSILIYIAKTEKKDE